MNAIEKKVLVTFVTLLKAYGSFGEAVQALMKSTKHISAELHEALASEVATKYECEFEMGTKGVYVFKNEDGSRHDAAGQFWRRNVGVFIKAPKKASSDQVDVLARRARSIVRDISTKRELDKLIAAMQAAYAAK